MKRGTKKLLKRNLRRSEITFISIGVFLILGSLLFVFSGRSLVNYFMKHEHDPFGSPGELVLAAKEGVKESPTPLPSSLPTSLATPHGVPAETPPISIINTQPLHAETPAPTPTPVPTETPSAEAASLPPSKKHGAGSTNGIPNELLDREKSYLLSPHARQVLRAQGSEKDGYSVSFEFEVEPKNTPSVLEISHDGKIILATKVSGNNAGSYVLKLKLPEAGLYLWQIRTNESESEKRELVIHP